MLLGNSNWSPHYACSSSELWDRLDLSRSARDNSSILRAHRTIECHLVFLCEYLSVQIIHFQAGLLQYFFLCSLSRKKVVAYSPQIFFTCWISHWLLSLQLVILSALWLYAGQPRVSSRRPCSNRMSNRLSFLNDRSNNPLVIYVETECDATLICMYLITEFSFAE